MALYAFDGTWNREHTGADYNMNSNVVRFAEAYGGKKAVYQKKDDAEHIVEDNNKHYVSGPGTRHGKIGWALGGLMGLGGRTRVAEAMKRVERKFSQGDFVIDVVGFSRGAAIALHFVNELAEVGALPGPNGEKVKARVRFLGLWDVVAAFGIPRSIGFLQFQKINLGWHLTLPKIVDHCFHAIALDERRESFRVTRVDGAYEVWFRGVHSDIGGGNENLPLNNITLRWMLMKAAAVELPIDAAVINDLKGDATGPVGTNTDPIKNRFRKVAESDVAHHTITIRKEKNLQNPPENCPRETPKREPLKRLVI